MTLFWVAQAAAPRAVAMMDKAFSSTAAASIWLVSSIWASSAGLGQYHGQIPCIPLFHVSQDFVHGG